MIAAFLIIILFAILIGIFLYDIDYISKDELALYLELFFLYVNLMVWLLFLFILASHHA